MKIKFDYFISDGKIIRIYHGEFTDSELQELIQKKFKDGELPCPINLHREDFNVTSLSVQNIEI